MRRIFSSGGVGEGLARPETSDRSDRLIVPRLADGSAAFYLPDTTLLSPTYAWYPRSIRRLQGGMDQMATLADSLHRHLDALPGSTDR